MRYGLSFRGSEKKRKTWGYRFVVGISLGSVDETLFGYLYGIAG